MEGVIKMNKVQRNIEIQLVLWALQIVSLGLFFNVSNGNGIVEIIESFFLFLIMFFFILIISDFGVER